MADAVAPPLSPVASRADNVSVPSAEASSLEAGGMGAKLSSGIDQLIAMLRPSRASEGYRSEDGASEASVGRPAAGVHPARPDANQQSRVMIRDLFLAEFIHASGAALQARAVLQRRLLVCHCGEHSTQLSFLQSLAACLLAHCKHAVL